MAHPERIAELRIGSDPGAWERAGFAVAGDVCTVGGTRLRLTADGSGIEEWTLAGTDAADWDGLPTELSEAPPASGRGHPNSVARVDHVVVFTPDLERTRAAFESNGVPCRRVREVGPPENRLRQGFFRLGEVICEVVEVPADQAGSGGAPRFWGITFVVADLDTAAAVLGDRLGSIHDAVQPGRRIATVRREAGLGIPVALITPEPEGGVGSRPPP